MHGTLTTHLKGELASLRAEGLYKAERVLGGPQGPEVTVGGRRLLNFCANNYLGLASDPRVVAAARRALDDWGFGLSSVRFICGTTELHKRLESELATFLGAEDAILYAACFDANGGLFESLLDADCAVISDRLNHASIIDGVRMCKARRLVYDHADLDQLAAALQRSRDARLRLIVTDGVFSMDGDLAPLSGVCDLAERYEAVVVVDDSHGTGVLGAAGSGTAEHCGVIDRVDLCTTTLGKALGGALGGCTAGPAPVIDWLRQKSRPYLFSNTLPPMVCGATLEVLRILREDKAPLRRLRENQRLMRDGLRVQGFDVGEGEHPIIPVHLRRFADDARLAQRLSADLFAHGVYAVGFAHPVVPRGQARIRLQVSAAHTPAMIVRGLEAFAAAGRRLGVV
ncbi:glycine C-acetyltransferase [bacterium]|nr:glycine C-acetyltransferase [bacterium]MBU1072341.1 glycine C-acetyltransferase [bacterium]MBU1675917.1 glycine C-acetyltransferase [bacterium]